LVRLGALRLGELLATFGLTAVAAFDLDDLSTSAGDTINLVGGVVPERCASRVKLRLGKGSATLELVTAGAFQLLWKWHALQPV
jgi:hypothetical protein